MRFKNPLIFFIFLLCLSTKTFVAQEAEVISFSAKVSGDIVKLEWITSKENNIKEYLVKRSIDNVNYFVVANMSAKNTQAIKSYTSTDKSVSGGINYYKLFFMDAAGKATELKTSKIDMVDKTKAITLIYDDIYSTIRLESGEQISSMELGLTDLLQRNYTINFIRDSTHALTVITAAALTPGIYFLKCFINGNRTVIAKLVVT